MSDQRIPDSEKINDNQLVSRALQGDKNAFGLLVSRYEKRVFALVLEMVRHRQDAEDITQEVFVRVYFSSKNFRAESSFYTWLYRVAYNMSIDFKRRVARRPQDALGSTAETSNISAVSDVKTPDQALENQERRNSIRSALSGISEEHRAVILLREVDGLSYDEIAGITGTARGTVMSRLHYARKHLQKVLRAFDVNAGTPTAWTGIRSEALHDTVPGSKNQDGSEFGIKPASAIKLVSAISLCMVVFSQFVFAAGVML